MDYTHLTDTVEKSPEDIQAEMARTREALTVKVAALENQVVGSVQTAADTLSGTVEAMKSFVSSAPGTVSETIKHVGKVVEDRMSEVFDLSAQVRGHPWAALGTSALLGCVTGWLIFRGRPSRADRDVVPRPALQTPAPPSRSGLFDDLQSLLGQKLREIAENAIDTAGEAVNRSMRKEVPKLVDAAAGRFHSETA